MFAIVWTLFITIGKGINNIKHDIENEKSRSKAKGLMYLDHEARHRLISNNHKCYMEIDHDYQRIRDLETGKIVWDEKDKIPTRLQEYKISAMKRNVSTYRCDSHRTEPGYSFTYKYDEIKGHQYKDFNTGQIFVIREFDRQYVYVDIATGKAVRYTDYQKIREKEENIYYKELLIKNQRDPNGFWWFEMGVKKYNENYAVSKYNELFGKDKYGLKHGSVCDYGEKKEEEIDISSEKVKEIIEKYNKYFH